MRTSLTLTIDSGSGPLGDEPIAAANEVARALRLAADRISYGAASEETDHGVVKDSNGNVIGEFTLRFEDMPEWAR